MTQRVEWERDKYEQSVGNTEVHPVAQREVSDVQPLMSNPCSTAARLKEKRRKRYCVNTNECRSPMCGIIIGVNVSQGQMVEAGEVLLVLEAMKMENCIRATKNCTVKRVNVVVGQSVVADQLMVEFE